MDGVPNDPAILANIAATNEHAQLIHPDNLPDNITFDDVIAPESLSEAGDLMMEIEDRILAFYVSAHEAALDAGNFDLADKIDQRFAEFDQAMANNKTFNSSDTFVSGAREAMAEYGDIVGDMHQLLLSDPQAIHELRHGSEGDGITNLGRAKGAIAVYSNQQFDSLVDAVEGDLEAAGLVQEAAYSPQVKTSFDM